MEGYILPTIVLQKTYGTYKATLTLTYFRNASGWIVDIYIGWDVNIPIWAIGRKFFMDVDRMNVG